MKAYNHRKEVVTREDILKSTNLVDLCGLDEDLLWELNIKHAYLGEYDGKSQYLSNVRTDEFIEDIIKYMQATHIQYLYV